MHDLPDAVDVGIGLGVNEAGIAVAGITADAFRGKGIGFVAFKSKGNRECVDTQLANVIFDGLHARLVGECWIGIFPGMKWLGGIEGGAVSAGHWGRGAKVSVDLEEFFSARVVRLHIGIGDGPRGRYAAFVLDDAEVFGSHARQSSAIDLGLAADEVGLLRVQWVAFLVLPGLFGVVAVVEEYRGSIPVELFLRHEGTALKDKDFFADLGEMESQGSSACSGADDDRIIFHAGKMRSALHSSKLRNVPPLAGAGPYIAIKEAVGLRRLACHGPRGDDGRDSGSKTDTGTLGRDAASHRGFDPRHRCEDRLPPRSSCPAKAR